MSTWPFSDLQHHSPDPREDDAVDDLVTWLRAALDEDERIAREAAGDAADWSLDTPWLRTLREPSVTQRSMLRMAEAWMVTEADALHMARWDPARVLAEVEAKRARIDLLAQVASGAMIVGSHTDQEAGAAFALRLLHLEAQPLAGRPGFRDEWRLT